MKKQWSVFLLAMVFMTTTVHAAKEFEFFLAGNKQFQEKNFTQALQEYEAVSAKGPVVWYNIGVCHAHLENPVAALIAFRKAERGASSEVLSHGLKATHKIQELLGKPHDADLIIFMKKYTVYFSLFWLQLCFLLLWIGGFVGYSFMLEQIKRFFFVWCLFLFLSGTLVFAKWWVEARSLGIAKEKTSFFVGPNKGFHKAGELEPGDEVILAKEERGWYKVTLATSSGWAEDTVVERIE